MVSPRGPSQPHSIQPQNLGVSELRGALSHVAFGRAHVTRALTLTFSVMQSAPDLSQPNLHPSTNVTEPPPHGLPTSSCVGLRPRNGADPLRHLVGAHGKFGTINAQYLRRAKFSDQLSHIANLPQLCKQEPLAHQALLADLANEHDRRAIRLGPLGPRLTRGRRVVGVLMGGPASIGSHPTGRLVRMTESMSATCPGFMLTESAIASKSARPILISRLALSVP